MMDKEIYFRKIVQLTVEKLKELIQLKTEENKEIIELAEREALDRGIDLEKIKAQTANNEQVKARTKEHKGVNWMGVIAEFLDGL